VVVGVEIGIFGDGLYRTFRPIKYSKEYQQEKNIINQSST